MVTKKKRKEIGDLIFKLVELEQAAAKLEMYATMHSINAAKNKCGYELAYMLDKRAPKP